MTVQLQNPVQYYLGPISVGTELSITDFTFIDNSHVSLKIRGIEEVWEYGTDYIVKGADTLVRTVIVNREVAADQVLAVYLDVPITQNISPEEGGNFPASTNEYVLDKLTYICQMLYARLSRTLQLSIDVPFDGTLYNIEANKDKFLVINGQGNGISYSAYSATELESKVKELLDILPPISDNLEVLQNLDNHLSNLMDIDTNLDILLTIPARAAEAISSAQAAEDAAHRAEQAAEQAVSTVGWKSFKLEDWMFTEEGKYRLVLSGMPIVYGVYTGTWDTRALVLNVDITVQPDTGIFIDALEPFNGFVIGAFEVTESTEEILTTQQLLMEMMSVNIVVLDDNNENSNIENNLEGD